MRRLPTVVTPLLTADCCARCMVWALLVLIFRWMDCREGTLCHLASFMKQISVVAFYWCCCILNCYAGFHCEKPWFTCSLHWWGAFSWSPSLCCCHSVPKSSLHDPTDCNMPGFSVLHYLPEFSQTHVHLLMSISFPLGCCKRPFVDTTLIITWNPLSSLESFQAYRWGFPRSHQALGERGLEL